MTAAHATDVLVATVREGKGEADQFAGVIGNVTAYASKLHVPFEEVGAALAAMTQLGTDPHTAVTQLSAFFSQILKVTQPMQKNAKRMGLGDIFTELQDMLVHGNLLGALQRLKNLGPLELAGIFPNVRAIRAALALVGPASGRVAQIFKRMHNTAGSAGEAFSKSAHTSQHAWDRFHASIQTLRISFAQGLLPVVTRVVNKLSNWLSNPKNIQRVRDFGKGLAERFQQFGDWFQKNWPAIQGAIMATANALVKVFNAMSWLDKHKGPSGIDLWHKATGVAAGFGKLATLHPGGSGNVHVHGNIEIHGVDDPKQLTEKIIRHSKNKSARTRGRGHPHAHFG
jgi:hypothetical protein